MFDTAYLQRLYTRLGERTPIPEFRALVSQAFALERSRDDLDLYRLSAGPWKKLADEVVPVEHWLDLAGISDGFVQFQLNSNVPDCRVWLARSEAPIGLEVTIAMGRQRYHLAKDMAEKGSGRGFIALPNDADPAAHLLVLAEEAGGYTTDEALLIIGADIEERIRAKSRPRFAGLDLLVVAPLWLLNQSQWDDLVPDLAEVVAQSPLRMVHVAGTGRGAHYLCIPGPAGRAVPQPAS